MVSTIEKAAGAPRDKGIQHQQRGRHLLSINKGDQSKEENVSTIQNELAQHFQETLQSTLAMSNAAATSAAPTHQTQHQIAQ